VKYRLSSSANTGCEARAAAYDVLPVVDRAKSSLSRHFRGKNGHEGRDQKKNQELKFTFFLLEKQDFFSNMEAKVPSHLGNARYAARNHSENAGHRPIRIDPMVSVSLRGDSSGRKTGITTSCPLRDRRDEALPAGGLFDSPLSGSLR
jgi:hypothetical protein